jgi:hypothetical protein
MMHETQPMKLTGFVRSSTKMNETQPREHIYLIWLLSGALEIIVKEIKKKDFFYRKYYCFYIVKLLTIELE